MVLSSTLLQPIFRNMGANASKKINDQVDQEQVTKEVASYPVVLYTKPWCGYCKMAKEILDKEKIRYRENDLDAIKAENPKEFQKYVNGLVYLTRHTKVPQIFICGKFIGGYTELNSLKETAKLWPEVERCSSLYDEPEVV